MAPVRSRVLDKVTYKSGCQTGEIYQFTLPKLLIHSWRATANQQFMNMFGFALRIYKWLAIAHYEKIDNLEKLNGYNYPV